MIRKQKQKQKNKKQNKGKRKCVLPASQNNLLFIYVYVTVINDVEGIELFFIGHLQTLKKCYKNMHIRII